MHIFAGTHKNQKIITPKGLETRPTAGKLRQSLFNICQGYIEDADFLDLFAGSGAMGLEALSRGAASATFVDSSKESIKCIQQNLRNMGLEKEGHALFGDVFQTLEKLAKLKKKYSIIYADPPYGKIGTSAVNYGDQVVMLIDKSPLLMPSGELFVEDLFEESQEDLVLETLVLVSSRRMGKACLRQYRKEPRSG